MGLDLRKLGKKITDTASRTYDQVNMLDNGRTYKQRTPTKTGSAGRQLTHNGATNFVGDAFVKPYARIPVNAANTIYNNTVAPAFDLPKFSVKQAPLGKFASEELGATGKLTQTGGDIIQTGANLLMPGSSKVVTGAFRSVAPKVAPDLALRAVANSGVGAVGGAVNNVGMGLSQDKIHSFNDVKNQALTGAKFGAVLGGAGTIGFAGAKSGINKARAPQPDSAVATQLKAQKQASIKAMDTANPKMVKQHVKNVNNIDKQLADLGAKKPKLGLKPLDQQGGIRLPFNKSAEPTQTFYHGSTNDKLTSLTPGAKTGLNEKRNLLYLTEDAKTAGHYAKNRGTDGNGVGVLSDSPTGKVYPVQVQGKVLGAYDQAELAKLRATPGFNKLSGKTRNMLTNDTGLSASQLENNPELVKHLTDNGVSAVRAALPNGGKANEIIVLNPKNAKLTPPATKNKVGLKKLDQRGLVQLPFGPKQNLHYSSSNGSTKISGKANEVIKQLTTLNEGGYAKIPGKTAEAATPTVTPPKTAPQIGAGASDYTDYLVSKYIDPNAVPTTSLRNPVTRLSTKAQEVYRGGVDKARDTVNTQLQKGLTSDNPIVASVTEKPTLGWNRFGLKDSTRTIFRTQRGNQENAGRVVRTVGHDLGSQVQALPDPATSMQKVDRFFEEPAYLKRAYGDGTKLSYEKLAPEEQKIVDTMIDMNKLRNDINLEIGNISPELHAKYADGTHSPRIYDIDATKGNRHSPMMDTNVGKKRVALKDIEDDTFAKRETNPVMRSLIRAEIALRDKATFDALKQLEVEGLIKDAAPNKNFTQLNGAQYGKFNGKYIYNGARNELSQSLTFNTKMGQAIGNLIDSYQDSPLGAMDRFFKSTKTTLSPATTAGNIISNPVAFNPAGGVNMFTQGKNMAKTSAKMIKDARGKFDRSLYEARKQGVGVGDTGKQLTGDKRVELGVGKKNSKNPYTVAGSFYGGVDQTAQVALYDELIKRGLKPEVAARRVMAGTQDYGGVGRGVQSLADAPLLGKPFARFTPELLRLTKNNVVYNPVGTAVKIGAVAKGADILSKASGETEEERKAREEAVGQTQIPYTNLITKAATGRNENLSLNFAVPKGVPVVGDSAVNIARLTGLNYPIEPGGDSTAAVKRQLNPIADITRKDAQGNTVIAPNQMVSSMTGRPIADQIANRDFMGRSITDPENKTYVEGVGEKGKKYAGTPSAKEQRDNRIRSLKMAYVPGANETDAVRSSIKGQKDYYGKERTKTQGILRAGGLKIESNSKEARQKRVESKNFFEGKAEQANKFLRENPDLKNLYSELTSNTRTRDTNTKTRDIISPERWSKIKGETSGRMFKQLKQESLDANKKDGQPVDPIFQLNSPERVKEVTELRSRPTGDDIEREEILRATTDWYKPFEQAERDYYSANSAYFDKLPKSKGAAKQNPRVEAYTNIPHPEQSALISQYYQAKNKGADYGKNFFKANATQLSKDFSSYKEARLKEINAKRAIEGFDPIKQDTFNNVTFGYEDDESKVAKELYYKLGSKGYGSGGYGSSDPYKYAVSLNQGSVGKPKAFKVSKSKAVAKKKIGKIKTKSVKSKV